MKRLFFLLLLVCGSLVAPAQVMTATERKELEAELKELREQMKNASPEERKQMEAMGLPALIKTLEKQLLNSGGNKEPKSVSGISEAEKEKIAARITDSPVPAELINPGDNTDYRVRSRNEFRIVDAAKAYTEFLVENNDFIGRVAAKPVSFAQAIAKAQAVSKGKIPVAELSKLKAKAPQGIKAAAYWQGLAAIQGMAGSPEAAFCFLVMAYEADPNDPDVFSNLAGAMATLGLANESLTVLDEIAKRNIKPSPPMGISAEDMLDYTRCYNLLLTGNTSGVRIKLERITKRQPLLSEAKKLLALLDEKEGKDGKPRFMVSQSRSPQVKFCYVYPGEKPEKGEQTYSIDIRSILDPSKGIRGKLPTVKYPQNPEQASDRYEGFLKENSERFITELQEISQLRSQLDLNYYVSNNSTQESWGYIIREIVLALDWRDVKLRELRDKIREAEKDYNETTKRVNDVFYKGMIDAGKIADKNAKRKAEREVKMRCMGMMKSSIEAVDRAIRDYFDEWSWMASMLSAAVGNEAWQKDIELIIRIEQVSWYHQLTAMAGAQTALGWMEQGREDVSETLEPVTPQKCDDGGKSLNFGLETPDKSFGAGVSVDCNGIGFEITGAKLSLELNLDKKGGYTIFGGPKVGAGIGGAGVEAKAGAYISGKVRGGTIDDVGAMVKASASVGPGPVSVSTSLGQASVSFVPGF